MTSSNWYVAYTYPKCEAKVNQQVERMGITSFLPTRIVEKKWSDRIKKIESPLFPSYLFIKTVENKIYDLLQIPELSRFIAFGGKFATIKEKEIDSVKQIVQSTLDVQPEAGTFKVGKRVKVIEGPLIGIEGLLIKRGSKDRFIVQIETLQQHIPVAIHASQLRYQ